MKKLLYIVLILVLLVGCSQKPKQVEQPVAEQPKPAVEQVAEVESPSAAETATTAEEVAGSNLFDARKIKEGDLVAGLKVARVEVNNAGDEDYDAYVDFDGEITVSGTFKHNLNDEFLDHEISFRVDEESSALLPKLAHDQRYVWFMFMNHDEAENAFGAPGTEGEATITIRNYEINYAHTEIWNTAELVRVDKK